MGSRWVDAPRIERWVWDVRSNIIYGSSGLFDLFGVKPAVRTETLGIEPLIDGIDPDDKARISEAISQAVAIGPFRQVYRVVDIHGEKRQILAVGQCLHDAYGSPTLYPGTAIDLTRYMYEDQDLAAVAWHVDSAANNEVVERHRLLRHLLGMTSAQLGFMSEPGSHRG